MRLTVETGPLAGQSVTLDRHQPVTLGSGDGCSLRLPDPGVRAQHAVIKALKDQGFGIKALAPGVRVNGAEVEAAPLADGDRIELGTTHLVFQAGVATGGQPHIAGFRILGELGQGGMGTVWRAEQVSLHRQVALKVLSRELTRDPQFVQRFVAEARAAAKLQHPNVVQVFDVDHDGDSYYYAMEIMHEGSLEAWLKKNGRMPVERALQVVADAASGLAYAESLGIVHRDIKPDNLMLDQHGTVKIADLGLARGDETGDEKLAGTPHFMAPEVVLKKGADHRSDLYALGCTFYRLVTGKTPFRGQTVKDILRAQVKDPPEPANKVEPSVPAEVAAIINRLLQKEPDDRYASANDLLAAVNELLQPPAKKGLWVGLAAAAVLVAGGATWWAINKQGEKQVVEVEKYRDNPEALRLYTENDELKKQALEDRAEIALLQAQLQKLSDVELAKALDQVAAAHPASKAATTAKAMAQGLRAQVQQREQEQQQRRARLAAAITARQGEVDQAITAGDFAKALATLAAAPPPEAKDEPDFTQASIGLRQKLQNAVAARLQALQAPIAAAEAQKDAKAMRAALDALAAAIDPKTGLPAELLPDRPRLEQALASGQQAANAIDHEKSANAWQTFDRLCAGDQGLGLLARHQFGAAAAAMTAFAEQSQEPAVRARGQQLAAGLQQAELFAQALATAAEKAQLSLAQADGAIAPLLRWQRDAGTLVLLDPGKKPPKELTLRGSDLSAEQWSQLSAQVPTPSAGARECFLTFVLLADATVKAKGYLQRLDKANADSGTGAQGYGPGPHPFDQILARLPKPEGEPSWSACVRAEATAGRLLTSGLRALSERRNLAAASHLEKLLGEQPHSVVVTALQ